MAADTRGVGVQVQRTRRIGHRSGDLGEAGPVQDVGLRAVMRTVMGVFDLEFGARIRDIGLGPAGLVAVRAQVARIAEIEFGGLVGDHGHRRNRSQGEVLILEGFVHLVASVAADRSGVVEVAVHFAGLHVFDEALSGVATGATGAPAGVIDILAQGVARSRVLEDDRGHGLRAVAFQTRHVAVGSVVAVGTGRAGVQGHQARVRRVQEAHQSDPLIVPHSHFKLLGRIQSLQGLVFDQSDWPPFRFRSGPPNSYRIGRY